MSFHRSITQYYQMIQEQYSIKYLKEMLIAILLIVTLGGGYFLNRMYVQYREQRAFVALTEVFNAYMQSAYYAQQLDANKDQDKIKSTWQDTQVLLDALYQENRNSYLAGYFLALQAQIVTQRDHDVDQAIEIMDQALAQLPKNTEMTTLFVMKRILMGFDSTKAAIREKALQDLVMMTQNPKDLGYEQALYLLGDYFLSLADYSKAQQCFHQLVDVADPAALIKSPWVRMAQEKLGGLTESNVE